MCELQNQKKRKNSCSRSRRLVLFFFFVGVCVLFSSLFNLCFNNIQPVVVGDFLCSFFRCYFSFSLCHSILIDSCLFLVTFLFFGFYFEFSFILSFNFVFFFFFVFLTRGPLTFSYLFYWFLYLIIYINKQINNRNTHDPINCICISLLLLNLI